MPHEFRFRIIPLIVSVLALLGVGVSDSPPPVESVSADEDLLAGYLDFQDYLDEAEGMQPRPSSEEVRDRFYAWLDEVMAEHGRHETVDMILQVYVMNSEDEAIRGFQRLLFGFRVIENYLQPSPTETLKVLGPRYPPDETKIRRTHFMTLMYIGLEDPTDNVWGANFQPVLDILEDSWKNDIHRYDGLVDFLFVGSPAPALLAMLELEGVDEEERDELFNRIVWPGHPYVTREDNLRAGSRERLHELLIEFTQGDSLWERVYAAEVLNKVPYMRDPEIEAALRDDPHWLIQRRMVYLDEEADDAQE